MHAEHGVDRDQFEPGVPEEQQAHLHAIDFVLADVYVNAMLGVTERFAAEVQLPYRMIRQRPYFYDADGGRLSGFSSIHHRNETILLGTTAVDVSGRRDLWERQRRLCPPASVGKVPSFVTGNVLAACHAARGGREVSAPILGMPASPGRVAGRVRVVRDASELDRLERGEILVAPVTTPAWTVAFGRAAAVVTDGGNLLAHASLVAREYGIPAVVGTNDATRRLRTGWLVTVDGSAGTVDWFGSTRERS